ncbi:General alpha-glucoside permease [Fusarium oxysporum f. sp. albedinis]|nr:General alpha-glucoside permease [Fusarium oxysporum f. sp. albedinis]
MRPDLTILACASVLNDDGNQIYGQSSNTDDEKNKPWFLWMCAEVSHSFCLANHGLCLFSFIPNIHKDSNIPTTNQFRVITLYIH